MMDARQGFVLVRGAGDLATGVIVRLSRAGFLVAALEIQRPTAIRRTVALSEAVYEGRALVEGIGARLAESPAEVLSLLEPGMVPVLVDPSCSCLGQLAPMALVDAIIAKRNLGTRIDMAPIVLALGPGFEAGLDAQAVIETNRGHDLGRVLEKGCAEADTGVPGLIGGYGPERVLRAPIAGIVEPLCSIGDTLRAGDPVFDISGSNRARVVAPFDGVVRGLIRPGFSAAAGFKAADIDPRCRREHCFSVSDKARAIGGGVLEAILSLGGRPFRERVSSR
jgi:xanthine dehydrogenase accessory factor